MHMNAQLKLNATSGARPGNFYYKITDRFASFATLYPMANAQKIFSKWIMLLAAGEKIGLEGKELNSL